MITHAMHKNHTKTMRQLMTHKGLSYKGLMTICLSLMALLVGFIAVSVLMQQPLLEKPALATLSQQENNHSALVQNYAQLPLHFEKNQGQSPDKVHYLSRGKGYKLYLTPTETVITLHKNDDEISSNTAIKMRLVGAKLPFTLQGQNQLPGKVNYLMGRNASDWITNIPTFANVIAKQVYPGIDLRYHGNQQQLEYDFIVAPGVATDVIKFRFEGIKQLTLNDTGDLVLSTEQGVLYHNKPVIYQNIAGKRIDIDGRYSFHPPVVKTHSKKRQSIEATTADVGFVIAAYDHSYPLIIDPVLNYASYLGGESGDQGLAIAVDSNDSAYVAGTTLSINFPTEIPFQNTLYGNRDAFIAKLNPSGNALVYATYLGGSGDDGEDENDDGEDDNDDGDSDNDKGMDIAVDSNGHLYITGSTNSDTDFPIVNALQTSYGGGSSDAYIAKLSPDGSSLVFSSYLGGSHKDKGFGIALDAEADIYLTGMTSSTDFPVVNAIQANKGGAKDAYIAKLSSDGSHMHYASYIGGSKSDTGKAIAVDSQGNATITGITQSKNDFPLHKALQTNFGGGRDAFISQLSSDGSAFIYSTYLGGSKKDKGRGIAIDSQDNVFVVGLTKSNTDFPLVNALQSIYGGGSDDGFISKINSDGSLLTFSSYLGGEKTDKLRNIAIDNNDQLYVVGTTKSTTGIPTTEAIQFQLNGSKRDAFISQLSNDGSTVIFGSYFGGSKHDRGLDIAVNKQDIYITGMTRSDIDFPLQNALQPLFGGGGQDAFIAKFSADNSAPEIISTPITTAIVGQTYSYTVDAIDPDNDTLQFSLQIFPENMVIDNNTGVISWIPDIAGEVTVTVLVDDNNGNNDNQSYTLTVTADATPPVITVSSPANGSLTNNSQITITGQLDKTATLTINNQAVSLNPDLTFSTTLQLANQGVNLISLTAIDVNGNSATTTLTVILDTLAPIITLTQPSSTNSVTNQDQLTITGTLSESASLSFNNVSVPVNADRSFSIGPITLFEGLNSFTLRATDSVGNNVTQNINVTLDTIAPVLTVDTPQNNTLSNQTNVFFSGSVTKPVNLAINGQSIQQNPDNSFSATIILAEGFNNVTITATDAAGNTDTSTLNINIDTIPPVLESGLINRGNPQNKIVMVTGLAGAAEPGALVHIINPVNGFEARVLAQSDGSFSTDIAGFANDSFQLFAIDAAGNQSVTVNLASNTPTSLTLDSIGNKIAPLGQTTRFTVTANDSEGNSITLGLTPVPLPAGMEYNITTGEFSFRPSNGQQGDYSLTFSAVNGDERVIETLSITVPAPSPTDPTVFTGRVLDANSFTQGSLIPVVGASISFLGSNVTATTDVDGYFSLTGLPTDAVLFEIDANTAQTAPDGTDYASFREGLTLLQHVVNQEERPFFLPRINADSLTQVDPATTTVVNNSALGITLTVPPHTAKNADGSDFSGQLSISEVPLALAPVALPDNLKPALLITTQPVGVTFATPVPITYPNVDNLLPNTEVDLHQVDRDLGIFVVIGIGLVSADGLRIETISGGVTANTWGFPAPAPPEIPPGPPPKNPNNDECNCPTQNAGSTVSLSDGRMGTRFTLPAYRSLEASRALSFSYQTNRANSRPVIPFNIGLRSGRAAIPGTISYQLEVAGLQQGKEVFVNASSLSGGSTTRSGFAFDGDDFKTGQYPYQLQIMNNFTATRLGLVTEGIVTVNNEENSAFGAGWMLAGLYKLAFNPDASVTLITPPGRMVTYSPDSAVANSFTSPAHNYATFARNPDDSFTHTEKDGIKMDFDAQGLITKHQDRNNNITAYQYDNEGKLLTITDPVGLITIFAYNINGLLDTVTDPANRITQFSHDPSGNLLKVTFPDDTSERFEYEQVDTHLITSRFDERNNQYRYRYDSFGRLIDAILPDNVVRAVANQTSKGLIDLESGLGTPSNPAPIVLAQDADADYLDGRGNSSSKTIDQHGRVLTTIDEVGRVTEHQRDADSNPTQTTRPIGSVVTRTFDNFGNVLTQKEEFNTATTRYVYDNFSLITQITNPRNHSTIINRDPANGNPLSIVNHLLHTTTMEYDTRGLVIRQLSPNGLETVYTYNAQGLMDNKTETPPTGSPGNIRLWTYSYFPTGLLHTVNTPDGITLNYTYDERSYLLSITDNLNQIISYSYDAHKNVVKTETLSSDDSLALLLDTIYDNRNRLTETRSPHAQENGETTEESITQRILDENSNLTGMIDPNGNASSNSYDPYNRLKTNTHREQGITTYQYDDQDRIIKIIAPNNVTTEYEYDIISRKTKEISPDRGTISYSYDLANNVTSITEGRSITAIMTYDELERIASKTYPNTIAGKIEDVIYTYDTCAFGLGYLCARDDESGNYDYDYDAYGNMTSGTFTEIEGIVYTMSYEYDDGDHISQMTMPSGRRVDYARDGVRRVNAIDTTLNGIAQNIVNNIQYRGDNQMLSCSYGNGTTDTRTYDLQGRLRSQQLNNSLNTPIDQRTYSYDKNSNILNIDSNTEDNGYQYDKLDRITRDSINAESPNTFSYDLNDNRLGKAKQDLSLEDFFVYQEDSNKVSVIETLKTGATPIENIVDREMIYNDVGRLFQLIEDGSLKADYIYNDQGQRTRKTVYQADGISVDNITIYHYDQMGYLITETTETGTLIKDYIWQEGMHPLAQIDNNAGTESIIYLYTDHLMTNRLATDQNQNIIWRWEGEAFGNTPAQELAGVSVNLRFPGQYFDSETNLHYNYYRYYDPNTGRYITSDPIGLQGGLNTYLYGNANPLIFMDFDGRFSKKQLHILEIIEKIIHGIEFTEKYHHVQEKLREPGLRRLKQLQEQTGLEQNNVDFNTNQRADCFDDCTKKLIDARNTGTEGCYDFQSCLDKCRATFNPLIKNAQNRIDRLLLQISRLNKWL